jgi:hypothetical protein
VRKREHDCSALLALRYILSLKEAEKFSSYSNYQVFSPNSTLLARHIRRRQHLQKISLGLQFVWHSIGIFYLHGIVASFLGGILSEMPLVKVDMIKGVQSPQGIKNSPMWCTKSYWTNPTLPETGIAIFRFFSIPLPLTL